MVIQTQQGFGDCLYLRPVIRWLPQKGVKLITSWPQAFEGLDNVEFVKPINKMHRTQTDNIAHSSRQYIQGFYHPDYTLGYHLDGSKNILEHYCETILGTQPKWIDMSMDVPQDWVDAAEKLVDTNKRICLVRPNTVRSEFRFDARNPNSEYFSHFIHQYHDKFHFISLANVSEGKEWYSGTVDGIDQYIENVPIETAIGLFKIASVILCSPSFWMPLAMCLGCNTLVIYGAHVPHFWINDKRMPHDRLTFVQPDPFDVTSPDSPSAKKDIKLAALEAAFKEVIGRC